MTRRLVIPLRTYSAELSLLLPEHNLSEADWHVLMAVLAAMRPALVEPDVVDAHIVDDDPLRLTPDEAIEVSLVLNAAAAGNGGALIRRGTDLAALADRLIAHERDTDA